jgi:serine protease Do
MPFFRIVLLVVVFALMALPCSAKIYKYQKDGVWVYTDTPPRDKVKESETMVESGKSALPRKSGGTLLLKDYPQRSAIEAATAATVAVKGGLGYGSGFFISTDGYLLTNKHVIRTTKNQNQNEKQAFDAIDSRIGQLERKFASEKKQLANYAADLKQLKRLMDREKVRARKKSYQDEYVYRLKRYEAWKATYQQRRNKFMAQQRAYQSKRADFNYTKSVANLSQSFTIVLVDSTELSVRLVAVSADHDLALLKLDGYRTPALKRYDSRGLVPGRPLYAIGNPVKLSNSVTSGVFSGHEQGFVQTNAQIYPGNSGGPLVTENGLVVGINTFKKITRKFEGLGFAIPIQWAYQAFNRYLD